MGERLVTDAEVLQEICHRYVAINRREAIQPAFNAILGAVDDVLPIARPDVEQAKDILRYQRLSARGGLHVGVMAPMASRSDELRPRLRRLSGYQSVWPDPGVRTDHVDDTR